MKKFLNLVFFVTILITVNISGALCCEEEHSHIYKSSKNTTFEFYSGGSYHISGDGEWIIKIEPGGNFSINHKISGKIKDYGIFKLTREEKSRIWKMIWTVAVDKLESSTRPGLPDEVMYTLRHKNKSVEIWIGDARKNGAIMFLVEEIGILIEKYTKQKVNLK